MHNHSHLIRPSLISHFRLVRHYPMCTSAPSLSASSPSNKLNSKLASLPHQFTRKIQKANFYLFVTIEIRAELSRETMKIIFHKLILKISLTVVSEEVQLKRETTQNSWLRWIQMISSRDGKKNQRRIKNVNKTWTSLITRCPVILYTVDHYYKVE